jgi:hypothetical protein
MVCDVMRHVIHAYRPTAIAETCAPGHSFWRFGLRHNFVTTDTVLFVIGTCFSSQTD